MDDSYWIEQNLLGAASFAYHSPAGHYVGGHLDDLVIDEGDLDEQTRRELLLDPNFRQFTGAAGGPDPKCRWCKGTGRLKMLTTETDCDCVSGS